LGGPAVSEISDAVHADAEAARAEIRAAGIACPSCGVNRADLPGGHTLTIGREYEDAPLSAAQCNYGTAIRLAASIPMSDAEYETWQAAANISLYDEFRKAEDEAWVKMTGGIFGPGSPLKPVPEEGPGRHL